MFRWKRYYYKIVPDADFKFYITASLKIRASRRYKELRALKKGDLQRSFKKYKNVIKMT